jgi:cytochrome c oxidase subunit II
VIHGGWGSFRPAGFGCAPPGISATVNLPARFDHTFRVEVIIAFVVFGLVLVVFVVSIGRSFTRRGRDPSDKTSYKKTETVYVSLVAAVAVFLVVFSLAENSSSHPRAALTVRVTGYQWCWRFDYLGSGVSVTADCVDGHLPQLVVPAGEPVAFEVTSADVIHSMWIPYLRFKLFAYPGHVNSFDSTVPTVGSWDGECAEFCGQYHYAMHFILRSLPAAQFAAWLDAQRNGQPR